MLRRGKRREALSSCMRFPVFKGVSTGSSPARSRRCRGEKLLTGLRYTRRSRARLAYFGVYGNGVNGGEDTGFVY